MTSVQSLDVVTIGEAMAMFTAQQSGPLADAGSYVRRLAGAELNVAIGLARLGFGVSYVTRVGADAFGEYIRRAIAGEGICTERVITDPRFPSGFQLKARTDDGSDPRVEYFRRGSAASTLSTADYDAGFFTAGRHLHLSGVAAAVSDSLRALCHAALDGMKQAGRTVSFDTNLRPSLWPDAQTMVAEVNALACKADWVLPGIAEGEILTGRREPEHIADFYLARGVDTVVIKLGPAGAYYKTARGEQGTAAPFPVARVVDTVGAGDSFAVGVISALLEGQPLARAARRGNLLGSLAVQVAGDSEGLPDRSTLDRLLADKESA